jgi:predicted TPR repeat methyltransferase
MVRVRPADEVALAILARVDRATLSPAVALMELLIETEDVAETATILRRYSATSPAAASVHALLEARRDGAGRVAAMLRADVDRPPVDGSIEDGIAFCRRLFDWSVKESEEASVALYSMGDAGLLAEATDEIVRWLEEEGVLHPRRFALDLGCGIGRMTEVLAPRLAGIIGIDVSSGMVERAQRRCAGLPNVCVRVADGRDLGEFADESIDLVLAVDVFPYLVQTGMSLAEKHVMESARVLRSGGDLVILQFSYRGDRGADVADLCRFAEANRLELLVSGATPFDLWDGLAFRLRRQP